MAKFTRRSCFFKMNKGELVDMVVGKTGMAKKDSEKAVSAFIEAITATLAAGESVKLPGFGSFEVKERAAREGRNPSTGEKVMIEAQKVPVFKAGKVLKEQVK